MRKVITSLITTAALALTLAACTTSQPVANHTATAAPTSLSADPFPVSPKITPLPDGSGFTVSGSSGSLAGEEVASE